VELSKNIDPKDLSSADAWFWAYWNKIKLQSGLFSLEGHEYLIEPMQSQVLQRVMKKGAQMGFTQIEILRTLHGMIFGSYPMGVLYLFPTSDDVLDFGKSRFKPILDNNYQHIGRYVGHTEAAELKQIGKAYLYLRGARAGSKVEGLKKESHKLRSIPVDKVVFDEVDLMDSDMIPLALERMSHSKIQEKVYLSTPTIPDFGIDRLYNDSDQRVWVIACPKCNRECCLELDFPSCVKFNDGKAYRACVKCGAELHPSQGRWVAQNTKSDIAGWWISQLNSLYVDPGKIISLFENPPNGNLQEVYNSKLAMAYISAENRLIPNDVYSSCGTHIIQMKDGGPCGMGIDVQGKTLVIVIGKKVFGGKKKIVWVGEVPDFPDAVELGVSFGVKQAAVDFQPETRKAREFQGNGKFPVYLCRYRDSVRMGEKADYTSGVVELARTEVFDMTGMNTKRGVYLFPRRCPQVEEFAKQMSNTAKILEEDLRRGIKVYRYRKLGPDHFRNAMNYFEVALKGLPESVDDPLRDLLNKMSKRQEDSYNPLTFGLKEDSYNPLVQ
jgi:hypothetical protein